MNRCDEFRKALDDVAAGGTASAVLAQHVRECESCAAELERLRALLSQIDRAAQAWMSVQPSADLVERVLAQARNEGIRRPVPAWWGVAASVAAAVIIVSASYEVVHHTPTASAPTVAPKAAVLDWRSPTAALLQPATSVLDIRSRGHLLDTQPSSVDGRGSGGNHAG